MDKNRIAAIRRQAGLSQSELAAAIDTTLSMMGKLERGERELTFSWLVKIANALKRHPSDLFEESPAPIFWGTITNSSQPIIEGDDFNKLDMMDFVNRHRIFFVEGPGLIPVAQPGWRVVVRLNENPGEIAPTGQLAFIRAEDDMFGWIGRAYPGSIQGRFHVIPVVGEPLLDQRLFDVAPVVRIEVE